MSLPAAFGRAHPRATLSSVLLAAVAALSGCGDSPVCVFGGGCQDSDGDGDGPGGIGVSPATTPGTGAWIDLARPEVEQMRPLGDNASTTSPIVIRFTESLNPDTLAGAFQITDGITGLPVLFLDPPALVGDGRVVVLDPFMDFTPGGLYVVEFQEQQSLSDLTGQLVIPPGDGVIGDFGVLASDPDEPVIVASYPSDNQINQSDLTEIVVVFDRVMDITTFDTDSWSVLVDGVPPPLNPPPVPYFIDGPTQIPVPNIFRWASVNPFLERVSLGPGSTVELTLSAVGSELEDPDDNVLPETQIVFDLAPIGVPSVAFKPTAPTDAFGLDDMTSTNSVLQVDLPANALDGDILRVYVFGTGPDDGDGLEAISRFVDVDTTTLQIDVTGEEMDLLGGGTGLFLEGPIDVAVSLERGNVITPVRLADADLAMRPAQSFFFDVVRPELLGLGATGTVTSSVTSDVRDLGMIGRADEMIRAVRVGTDAGLNNYTDPDDRPPVAISDESGLFVAAPVALGVLDASMAPPLYTVEIFDRAMNSAMASVGGRFDQVGAVGPGGDPTGGTMQVTVFDAISFERLENALVITHQDDGGAITLVDSVVTGVSGFADPDGAAVGETIVTVDLPGYDLFTFHGAPQTILAVPLVPTGVESATTGGRVTTPFDVDLSDLTSQIGDSRSGLLRPRLFDVAPCTQDPISGGFECPFGPDDIVPARVGIQTVLSADLDIVQAAFDADDFLAAFSLRGPTAHLDAGDAESVDGFEVDALLASLGPEERPIPNLSEILPIAGATLLDAVDGSPSVTIEAITPGLNGSSVVGLGIAYDPLMTEQMWDIFSAYPGAVDGIDDGVGDELGELIVQGTFEADLFMRAEVADVDGDRVGVRARFSNLDGTLDLPGVPVFNLPGPGGMSGGLSYNVVVADAIPDSAGAEGMYRVTLTDTTGRSWTLWRPDPPNMNPGVDTVTIHVPNIGVVGGMPLVAGDTTCVVSALAWETLDPDLFMWSDVEREHELFAQTAPVTFTVN